MLYRLLSNPFRTTLAPVAEYVGIPLFSERSTSTYCPSARVLMSIVSASNKPDSTSTPVNEYRLYTYLLVEDKPFMLTTSDAGCGYTRRTPSALGTLKTSVEAPAGTSLSVIVIVCTSSVPMTASALLSVKVATSPSLSASSEVNSSVMLDLIGRNGQCISRLPVSPFRVPSLLDNV